ncbi:MAG: reverse transcriptase family protein [Phycisphaerales bacterium]|nr:reverse transcriptase family protein [Phycisphaerales bacterium]
MKQEEKLITDIKTDFQKMQSVKDLLAVLNKAKPLVYGDHYIPFELKQLTWYANPKLATERYTTFTIKKKSGADRSIHAPVKGLKALQRTLSFVLQHVFEPHKAAMGFVLNRSIIDNAQLHVGSRYVYNIDLKDFFPSIDQARVWKCLQLKPFNLINNYYIEPQHKNIAVFDEQIWLLKKVNHCRRLDIAHVIASLCCTEMEVERKNKSGEWEKVKRNVLPQGAPTSPIITNIVCQKLDYLLTGVAKRFGVKYSRYADDISFSSMHNVYQPNSDFLNELHRIISEQNFHIKESKTRLQKDGYRKEVTGLLVHEKVNVQQRYIKQLRMWLYYWERYGYERAASFFLKQYVADKGHVKNNKPDMLGVIYGKLNYLQMVKGKDNELYLKLRRRFDKLIAINKKNEVLKTNIISLNSPNLTVGLEGTKKQIRINITPLDKGQSKLKRKIVINESINLPYQKLVDNDRKSNRFETNKTDDLVLPIQHTPKELMTLLKNFSLNDSTLKYATHSWDVGRDKGKFKDLSNFLRQAQGEYNNFKFKLKELSPKLNAKIYGFLFNMAINKDGWGINRIKFGWSSPELLTACNTHIDLMPEDFIVPAKFQVQIAGKTIQKFKQVIDIFKNEIEIRDEHSALLNLILEKHDNKLISFAPPRIHNLENKSFYTDVQWLSKALDKIFDGIKSYSQHPEVEYFVSDNSSNDRIVLNILHKNSYKIGLSIDDEKLNLKTGDFGDIKNYLKNLCDWSIESKFKEGFYRINYLTSDQGIPAHEKIESTEGFKHILTFYK